MHRKARDGLAGDQRQWHLRWRIGLRAELYLQPLLLLGVSSSEGNSPFMSLVQLDRFAASKWARVPLPDGLCTAF